MSATNRKSWGAAPLHSTLHTSHNGDTCRVCALPVDRGAPAWSIAWKPGLAHEACGYLRADEKEIHRVASENDWWWAWACPACGNDAASHHRPLEGDPLECRRCRKPTVVVGAIVAATGVGLRAVVGHATRSTFVQPGDRGIVVAVRPPSPLEEAPNAIPPSLAMVRWEKTERRPEVTTRARFSELRPV